MARVVSVQGDDWILVPGVCIGGATPGAGCTSDTNCAGSCAGGKTPGAACMDNFACRGGCSLNSNVRCSSDQECAGMALGKCTAPPPGSCTNPAPGVCTCDDGNPCTTDGGTPAGSGCTHTNNTVTCSDGNPCTVGDACLGGICTPGSAPQPSQFCSAGSISIADSFPPTKAVPYPSTVNLSGVAPLICSVTVSVNGLSHTFPDDIDILLAGPAGQNTILMSDVGGGFSVNGVNLTLADSASSSLPDNGPLISGTFKPTNVNPGTGTESWPAPAPSPSGGSALSAFSGTNPNGTWSLFVVDDEAGDAGSLIGWCLNLATTCSIVDCNDGDPCTDDSCNVQTGVCSHTFNIAPCNDGDLCTLADACSQGVCVGGPPLDCSDGNPCTDDLCCAATGCYTLENSDACDDGNPCTVGDVCSLGTCVAGGAPNCDDGNPCTDDSCSGGCGHTYNANPCNDGNLCTSGDQCNQGSCTGMTVVTCSDGNPCTDDACDPVTGCIHTASWGGCEDGNPCTIGDTCFGLSCIGGLVDESLLPAMINSSVQVVGSTISWTDPPGPYSVYRGVRLGTGYFTYNETCLVAQTSLSSTNDTQRPSAGSAFYYLIARVNTCGPSVLTVDSFGEAALNLRPCPMTFATDAANQPKPSERTASGMTR